MGPTPSPETLKQFKELDPSFAERAFQMSEDSVKTANYERRRLVDGDVSAIARGQWMSVSLTVLFVVAAGLFFWAGSEVLAALCLAPPVFQFLGKMVRTVRQQENDQIPPASDGDSSSTE